VFDGAVLVRPAAQQTDAVVANHNLLLSDHATVNSKPQFNIHADDVKCTHAATVGQLRAEEVFYLRSRGLDLESARALLLEAFAAEVLTEIRPDPLRAALHRVMVQWLPRPVRLAEAA
jgi:Fe-S cluster assembly protein SufD